MKNQNLPGCTGCHANELDVFFEVPRVPANVGSISNTRAEAEAAPCGAIRLVACRQCGLIANQLFDCDTVGFKPGYEVSLKHSEVFRQYIQGVCARLIDRYELRGKHILEIGCGDGDFLRMLCASGGNHGVGIDPTIAATAVEDVNPGTVRFISDYYSKKYENHIGDFVCCLSVFEDIPRPLAFLQELRRSIADRKVNLYFEVFNGYRSIRQREVWSIHYEQCNYFSLESLEGLFRRAGFEILDLGACYQGDQYLFIEARPGILTDAIRPNSGKPLAPQGMIEAIQGFGAEYQRGRDLWQQRLQQWGEDGSRVVVWGSGGKGISFLSAVSNAKVVDCVVDVNPNRQGHYMPITGHEIIAPSDLSSRRPDIVILTNALYQDEISAQLKDLGIECQLLVA